MSIDNVAYPAHRPAAAAKPARKLPVGLYVALKPATDALAAAVLLILTSPLIAAAIVLVKLTSPGPVIYSQ
ncbi:sugar transferase, partial [Escherichia coli]|nr:sugar transferase [Escherichia coli]